MSDFDTALVWHVEPTDSWPLDDPPGDEPAKLVPAFDPDDLSAAERDIREELWDVGGVGDSLMCGGGLARLAAIIEGQENGWVDDD